MNEKTDSERLRALEEKMAEIQAFIGMRTPGEPTIEDFQRAIEAYTHGDKQLLEDYMSRAKIPSMEVYKSWARETYGDFIPVVSRRRSPVQALRKGRGRGISENITAKTAM